MYNYKRGLPLVLVAHINNISINDSTKYISFLRIKTLESDLEALRRYRQQCVCPLH